MKGTKMTTPLRSRVISSTQLVAALMACKGATPISFTAVTEPKMNKTGNPYLGTTKQARVNGMVNFHYEDGVIRRLEKEGKTADDFKQGTSWHTPVLTDDGKLTPLCQHKQTGVFYLRFMHLNTIETRYFYNGVEVSEDKLEPYMPKKSSYDNQGLDNPLRILTYSIGNIVEASFLGERFIIKD
jgi:hypothetical protein